MKSAMKSKGGIKLKNICLERASQAILGSYSVRTSPLEILDLYKSQIRLPVTLSQELFDFCMKQTACDDVNRVLEFFNQAPDLTPLHTLYVENSTRADVELVHELVQGNKQKLTHIDVRGCRKLPRAFWSHINKMPKLHSLKTTDLLIPLQCPKLEILVIDWRPRKIIQRVQGHLDSTYYDSLLENVLPNLKYLDLSWCCWISKLSCLRKATNLEVLILRNATPNGLIDDITQLKGLRVLDISVGLDRECDKQSIHRKFSEPEVVLEKIVTSLKNLEHLNISGTNLITTRLETNENALEIPALQCRLETPLKFLGIYSLNFEEHYFDNLPAITVSGNGRNEIILEAIKHNHDMPRTLQDQLVNLRSFSKSSFIRKNNDVVANQLITVLKNLRRADMDCFAFWSLKTVKYFLDHFHHKNNVLPENTKIELFLAINRVIYSFPGTAKVPETLLSLTFEVFIDLFSFRQLNIGKDLRREIVRLSNFLLTLNEFTFIYLKTEALLYRLLYWISLVPEAATHLANNKIITMCFDFFRTLQIYLGFSLNVREISRIVPLVWKSILSFIKLAPAALNDFLKYNGLSWMNAHLMWFKEEQVAKKELINVYKIILQLVETSSPVTGHLGSEEGLIHGQRKCFKRMERMVTLRTLVQENEL